jgi:hypothetical protein
VQPKQLQADSSPSSLPGKTSIALVAQIVYELECSFEDGFERLLLVFGRHDDELEEL